MKAGLIFDQGTLILEGMPRGFERLLPPGALFRDERIGKWRCDAMHYHRVKKILRANTPGFKDAVPDYKQVKWGEISLHEPRPGQERAVKSWRKAGGRGLIVMPTGTGKTETALYAMEKMECPALIVAPVRDLMYQWHRRILQGLGYDAGIVGDNIFNARPVTVTTYDSAAIHMKNLGNRFQLVIFDEAHHLPGKFYREAALMCIAPFRMGLTATPERSDGRHEALGTLIGPTVYYEDISQAKGKTLADYNVIRIPVALDASEQKKYDAASELIREYMILRREKDPKFDWKALLAETGAYPQARKVQKAFYFKRSIEDRAREKFRVLEDLFRLHYGEKIIIFTGSNQMAIDVSKRFLVPTILSHSKKRERLEVLEGFASGKFPALAANRVLDEGVDIPSAKTAVVLGGLGAARQAKQRLGRVLRPQGDARAVLYEVVCQSTGEEERSRKRRRSDAYKGTLHRKI